MLVVLVFLFVWCSVLEPEVVPVDQSPDFPDPLLRYSPWVKLSALNLGYFLEL